MPAPASNGNAVPPEPEHELLGRFLGPYLLVRALGRGGMGAVYLAEHPALGRNVAVKVLTAGGAADPLALERFRREARAAAALDHPNIVRLFDIGECDGLHYLVLEYLDGTDLQTVVQRDGPLPVAEAAAVVAQAAAGLHHAHTRGFLHRDVKPANLFRTAGGVVKVLDMGLARPLRDDADRLTGKLDEECIVGTVDFLSPEQAVNGPLDPRADVYALGATFYALLTGAPPFAGSTVQKLAQVQFTDPPRADAATAGRVPPELAAVVARMMAKSPRDRYPSAAAVVAALAPWLPADLSAHLRADPGAGASLSEVLRTARTRRRARVAVVLALLSAVVSGVALWTRSDTPRHAVPAPEGPPPGEDADPVPLAELRLLDGHTDKANDVAFSADGTRLASIATSGHFVVWDAVTGRQVFGPPRAGPRARFWACAGTPNGYFLAGGSGVPVLAVDWRTGDVVRRYEPFAKTVVGLAAAPDGRQVAVCGVPGTVELVDPGTWTEVRRLETGAGIVWQVTYSADGELLAGGTGGGGEEDARNLVFVWRAADGAERHRLRGHAGEVRAVAFHPNGTVLASGGFDGAVILWNLDTRKEVRRFAAHAGFVERVHFVNGGKYLLTCGGPDEGAKGSDTGSVRVWDADSGRELRAWSGGDWHGLVSLAVSPDGRFLAAGGRDGFVRLWPFDLKP